MMETFDRLPLAATVNGEYFCVNGGISQRLTCLDDINNINRKMEIPSDECLFADLMWADPAEDDKINID